KLLRIVEADAALPDELGMSAAPQKRRRQTAGKRLEQGVGARIVAARGEVHVVRAQQIGERLRGERADGADPLELRSGTAGEGDLEGIEVEVPVEPPEDVGALARIV